MKSNFNFTYILNFHLGKSIFILSIKDTFFNFLYIFHVSAIECYWYAICYLMLLCYW